MKVSVETQEAEIPRLGERLESGENDGGEGMMVEEGD